jgi:hypothetical protein
MATWSTDLAVRPYAVEFAAIWPPKDAQALKLTILEFPLEDRAIRKDFLAMALYTVPVKWTLVPRAIWPLESAAAFPDAVAPLSHVTSAIWPSDSALAIHAAVLPRTCVNPTLICTREGALALLLSAAKVPCVVVARSPYAHTLAVEEALSKLPGVRFT